MTLDNQVLGRPSSPAPGAAVRSIFSQLQSPSAEPQRIALVGTFTPRKCGIATFGNDIFEKLAQFHPHIEVDVYPRSEEHTSELQSRENLVCRLLLEKKK